MKVGDKIYRPWHLDINDICEYTVIGIKGDVIILPDKVYSTKHKIKLSDMDKKLSCFFTTYDKAVDNIWHNIQKGIRRAKKQGDEYRTVLEWYLEREAKFIEDRSKM